MTDKRHASTNNSKDVIYVDVDDEITGIIEKVRDSQKKIVALVLPKRAAVLQSVVNMKLLKRTADGSKKNLVLITSEAGLLPLAGSVGLHVAKSLQSKPEIPETPDRGDNQPEEVQDDVDDEPDITTDDEAEAVDKTRTVGELAGAAVIDDTIELDDDTDASDSSSSDSSDGAKPAKGKDKKFKIPNFSRFRLMLVLAGLGVVALIALGYVAFVVMPKAQISIKTDATSIDSAPVLTLKTQEGTKLDVPTKTLAAHQQQVQKVVTQQVAATGQQNNGTKASGTIKFYNCNKDDTLSGTNHTIPAGTGVSANGLTFITAQAVTVEPSHFLGNNCTKDKVSASVTMTAQVAGAKYNQDSGNYSVAGYTTITGVGSATTGGTDDIIKVVTQADIDSATQKIGAQDASGIKEELKTDLNNGGFLPIEVTYGTAAPDTKTSAKVGDAADNVTVTQTINYTMLGVKEDDLKKILADDVSEKIDPKKQSILDYGLEEATFSMQNTVDGGVVVNAQTTVLAGPDLNTETIKKQVAGKKSGDAQEIIKAYPGVTTVKVTYSPFWVSSIPKNTGKIVVTVEKPQAGNSDAKP